MFVRLIFDVVGHRQNIFNDENFPIYGRNRCGHIINVLTSIAVIIISDNKHKGCYKQTQVLLQTKKIYDSVDLF